MTTSDFDARTFQRLTGQVNYNPVENFAIHEDKRAPTNQQSLSLCRQGAQLFTSDALVEAMCCFKQALDLNPRLSGVCYAQAVCLSRMGKLDAATKFLRQEIDNSFPHPNAQALLQDIEAWSAKKHKSGEELLQDEPHAITIFTMPKPFRGHTGIIQRNAIRSWIFLQQRPEILLLGNEEGTAEVADEFGVTHVPHVERNQFGTPLLNSIFEIARSFTNNEVMMYVNADIILIGDLICAVRKIRELFAKFLIIGQRWDINMTEPISFPKTDWQTVLRETVKQTGTLHSPTGIDYFVFADNTWDNIPPFALGRTSWDGWLLFKALSSNIPVIDATESILAIHQNHNYDHIKGGYTEAWSGIEAKYNQALMGGYIGVRSVIDAKWCLINSELLLSSYSFSDLANSQRTSQEFATRLYQQGALFLKDGKPGRALSCLEEANRNDSSVPGLAQVLDLAREKTKMLRSAAAVESKQVSVIIPTYNRCQLLKRAIQSVLTQTYQDIEVIVVDDASTDETQLFVDSLSRKDTRIRYLHHNTNRGAQTARNSGIRVAKGEWIAFLDSDDEWLPEKIERQLEVANREHVSVVHCECYIQSSENHRRRLFRTPPYSGNIYRSLLRHPGPLFSGLFVRKENLDIIGLLDEEIQSYQEWDTSIRLAKHCRFGFIDEPLFVYHLHSGETISKDMTREADGWAQIVRKHETEILREAGSDALKKHYEILCKKYYSVKDYELADLYKHQAINL